MIGGVHVHRLDSHVDERGSLTELLRSDWPGFTRFGQAIVTVNLPGVVRGWHAHRRQTDVIVPISGRVLVPLYDARDGSRTRGAIETRISHDGDRFALFVPPGVFHGYKTLDALPAIIVNFPDQLYDTDAPDEIRLPHDAPQIGYDWDER